ncbi:MAG: SDR family NAD(P)-dependent oxidoreductase [Salipiger thiooxidans]|uniref:SDR family NAD(P)-dependent oxidoreductase n=1 Tax=Salipiger thiooxidans TaxID=282683 RepID=UPI001CD6F7E0|nr:glucose 1-dehydrogenase [Salipiger thiooxidans]MCA0847875.1 glucose 1-dehydrogenase [Salipiger thiooxidans]
MQDQTAIITGAADGIGWAMAQGFAEAGYRVLIADLDGDKAASRAAELGAAHAGAAVDVTRDSDVTALAELADARFGRCDVLVNNAGIADRHLPTLEQDMEHFGRVLDVHLKGTFMMSRAIGARMIAAGSGAIVNIGSIAGVSGMPRRNAYGAAKAGIVSMTRAMACEWAGQGLRVNAIIPGYVETALVRALIAEGKIDADRLRRRIPMGHLAQPGDIAAAALFLVSGQARYITGTTLTVDGGWSAFGDSGDASAG